MLADMFVRISAAALLALALPSRAVEFNDTTLALLKSTNRNDRARFYAFIGKLTPEENNTAVKQMREAWDFHKTVVGRAVIDMAGGQNTWASFLKAQTEWRACADALLKDIHTDWHKDAKKVSVLTIDMGRCAKLHERMRQTADAAERGDFARLQAACGTLIEIEQQIANATAERRTFKPNPAATLLRAVADLPDVAAKVKALADFRVAEKKFAAAEAWNASQRWAQPDQKRFATILNEHRRTVGYQPLRLDEKLSAACTGHSAEMVSMKYFSHESPVSENKTFGDRARNAGFEGGAGGECIFAGSRSPDAAYSGWWGSDGHRFIMFSEGANTIGIGNAGTDNWTFNPGGRSWPAG